MAALFCFQLVLFATRQQLTFFLFVVSLSNGDSNQLSGIIPSELGLLENLAILRLGKIFLKHNAQLDFSMAASYCFQPAFFCYMSTDHLSSLVFSSSNQDSNQLSGIIPSELGLLKNLLILDLGEITLKNNAQLDFPWQLHVVSSQLFWLHGN